MCGSRKMPEISFIHVPISLCAAEGSAIHVHFKRQHKLLSQASQVTRSFSQAGVFMDR